MSEESSSSSCSSSSVSSSYSSSCSSSCPTITECNEKGYVIYLKYSDDGTEEWKEWDDNNNLIHFKNSNGFEYWNEYDEYNNDIHHKNNEGYEDWREYDGNNNWGYIHRKTSDGIEEWCKYENGKQIQITKKEFKWIEFKEKEKEFLSRTPVSRFKLMDI